MLVGKTPERALTCASEFKYKNMRTTNYTLLLRHTRAYSETHVDDNADADSHLETSAIASTDTDANPDMRHMRTRICIQILTEEHTTVYLVTSVRGKV